MMAKEALTRDEILRAAEDVLRRHGPMKATVVDVARVLGVSHGTVYRHFPTKVALREAITRRWLDRAHGGLADIVAEDSPAEDRLRRWLTTLFAAKKDNARRDPELFATYSVLCGDVSSVVEAHLANMLGQLSHIVSDGMEANEFAPGDPIIAARAVFHATARYHDPGHVNEWSNPEIDGEFHAVCSLVIAGLRAS